LRLDQCPEHRHNGDARATSQPTRETPHNQWTMARGVELLFEMLLRRMVSVNERVSEVIRFEEA